MTLAAVGLWLLGRRLNRGRQYPNSQHALYSLPVEWYAVPFFASGLLLVIASLLAPALLGSQRASRKATGRSTGW